MEVINSEDPKSTTFHDKWGCFFILTVFSDCDTGLFELALQLREKRLDIEEALVEEKKTIDNLKKEYDTMSKKVCWSAFLRSIYPFPAYATHPLSYNMILPFHSNDIN